MLHIEHYQKLEDEKFAHTPPFGKIPPIDPPKPNFYYYPD